MAKRGHVAWFVFLIIAFVIILAASLAFILVGGGDAYSKLSCAIGKILFIGCPETL